MLQNSPVQPRLGLNSLSDAAMEDFAAYVVSQLTLHSASFADMNPELTTLANALDNYQTSLVAAKTGTKTAIDAKNDARNVLENILTYCANSCSEIANGNVTLFKLSGFDVRNKPTPSGMLPAPANFTLTLGPVEGTLKAKFKPVKNNYGYEIKFGAWNTDPETWTNRVITTSGRGTIISDLASGQRYSARCRAMGAKGIPGEWSTVATIKTY